LQQKLPLFVAAEKVDPVVDLFAQLSARAWFVRERFRAYYFACFGDLLAGQMGWG
jgi:hypothetical protein